VQGYFPNFNIPISNSQMSKFFDLTPTTTSTTSASTSAPTSPHPGKAYPASSTQAAKAATASQSSTSAPSKHCPSVRAPEKFFRQVWGETVYYLNRPKMHLSRSTPTGADGLGFIDNGDTPSPAAAISTASPPSVSEAGLSAPRSSRRYYCRRSSSDRLMTGYEPLRQCRQLRIERHQFVQVRRTGLLARMQHVCA
jgi:hypothetical protein